VVEIQRQLPIQVILLDLKDGGLKRDEKIRGLRMEAKNVGHTYQ
jgi:hypothetical protein